MLHHYAAMFEFLGRSAARCRLHVMERRERTAGTGENADETVPADFFHAFWSAVEERVIGAHRRFWALHYPEIV